jgi:hypothetical protein
MSLLFMTFLPLKGSAAEATLRWGEAGWRARRQGGRCRRGRSPGIVKIDELQGWLVVRRRTHSAERSA